MPVINDDVLVIRPSDLIVPKDHLIDTFGEYHTETSAKWILSFAISRNSWKPFTYEEIEKFYNEKSGYHNFSFNKLVTGGFIVDNEGESYSITFEFVLRILRRCLPKAQEE